MLGSVSADQDQSLPHLCDDFLGEVAVFFSRGLALDDVDALEEAHSSDVSDEVIKRQDLLVESLVQVLACLACVFLQLLPVNDIQHCTSRSHRHRVAAEGAEEFHIVLADGLCDFFGADDSPNWKTVSHSLTDR